MEKWVQLPLERHQIEPLRVIADGAVQTVDFAEGRLLPVLIIDTTARPDVEEHVRLHQGRIEGDVKTTWCKVPQAELALLLELSGPSATKALIGFDLSKQSSLVDHIVQSRGLYLQPGRPGDRVKDTFDKPKIIVEVAASGFDERWDKMFLEAIASRFVSSGLGRKMAKTAAREHIVTWRQFTKHRIRRPAITR